MIVVIQLSSEVIKAPVPSCNSKYVLCNGSETPYGRKVQRPRARIITLFASLPCTINLLITTLSPVSNKGARAGILVN